jgi:hypothetical protein
MTTTNAAPTRREIREATPGLEIKIIPNDKGNPPGKVADAELVFTDGPLAGLRLIGFGVWERRGGHGRNVTFPARQYSVNGERRSFALLRPVTDAAAQNRIRDLILNEYEQVTADNAPDAWSGPTATERATVRDVGDRMF